MSSYVIASPHVCSSLRDFVEGVTTHRFLITLNGSCWQSWEETGDQKHGGRKRNGARIRRGRSQWLA
ncbi:hypothetical protein PENTCL1PPCAC_39, partial [Pristionchus entomophagus]